MINKEQYVYKDGRYIKLSSFAHGASIEIVDILPKVGNENTIYLIKEPEESGASNKNDFYLQYIYKDGKYRLAGGGGGGSHAAVLEDTITIKEMTIKPSTAARKMVGHGVDYSLCVPFTDAIISKAESKQWVPDPILFIKTNYISDKIYNKIISSNTVVLKLNKLTKPNKHRKSWRGARFTCRDSFYIHDDSGLVYMGDENRDLWIKYHIIHILPSMVKEDDYGKYIEVSINLLERSLTQLQDLNSDNTSTLIAGSYTYETNPQLSPAKISKALTMGRDTISTDADIKEEQTNSLISSTELQEKEPEVIDLTNTKWQFNQDQIDVWGLPNNQSFNINFSDGNDANYTSMVNQDGVLVYSDGTNNTTVFNNGWVSSEYSLISIIDGDSVTDNSLINFIKQSAVQTPAPEPIRTKIIHNFHIFPQWKSFKETKLSMPVWRYSFKGTGNFIPVESSYRYVLDFRPRFDYSKIGGIEQYKEVAIHVWDIDGFGSFPTFGLQTPDGKSAIASPLVTTLDFEQKCKLAIKSKFVKELIQPSFGILEDNWLDVDCKHIWKEKFKNPDKYISISPREVAYILEEDNYPVDYWFGITYKLCKFN